MNTAQRALRLGFAGTPRFAVPALDAVHATRHELAAVFTQPDRPAGRGRALQPSAVKQRALEHGLTLHQPDSFKTAAALELLRGLELDALVVVAYGQILPAAVLAVPLRGCFNIHASLLPRWRGAAPIQRALLAGDSMTGVTIMRMEAGLDTGPMIERGEVRVAERETAATLHDKLAECGAALIVQVLDAVAAGTVRECPQPQSGVTYAAKIAKGEARIDWCEDAASILRRVRAFNPWPVAETMLDGVQLRVWDADLAARADSGPPGTVIGETATGIDVACGSGALRLLRLQLAGRKAQAAQDFMKAYRLTGARFASA